MNMRRSLLKTLTALPLLWTGFSARTIAKPTKRRLRPADAAWPKRQDWKS